MTTLQTLGLLASAVALGAAVAWAMFYRRFLAQERTIRRQMARESALRRASTISSNGPTT